MQSFTSNHWFRVGAVSVLLIVAWHWLVSPTHQRLRKRQAQAADLSQVLETRRSAIEALPAEPKAALDEIETGLAAYAELWQQSSNTAGLYDRLATLAASSGVQIERIEPRRVATTRGPARSGSLRFEAIGYRVDVIGNLASISRFTQAIQQQTGLSTVDAVRIVPTGLSDDHNELRASVRTTHQRVSGDLVEEIGR